VLFGIRMSIFIYKKKITERKGKKKQNKNKNKKLQPLFIY